MYRIKLTGYVLYLEGEDEATGQQRRLYGSDPGRFNYLAAFRDPAVLNAEYVTVETARQAMRRSYRGVDQFGLGYTWVIEGDGALAALTAFGIEALTYVEKGGDALWTRGSDGEPDRLIDFTAAYELVRKDPSAVYVAFEPRRVAPDVEVNPATEEILTQHPEDDVCLCRAWGVGPAAGFWRYYLQTDGQPAVIDPQNPDPEVAAALGISPANLADCLAWRLANCGENPSEDVGVTFKA